VYFANTNDFDNKFLCNYENKRKLRTHLHLGNMFHHSSRCCWCIFLLLFQNIKFRKLIKWIFFEKMFFSLFFVSCLIEVIRFFFKLLEDKIPNDVWHKDPVKFMEQVQASWSLDSKKHVPPFKQGFVLHFLPILKEKFCFSRVLFNELRN